jgi:hypothetical protein
VVNATERHEQVWVKVNVPVDRGIARVVSILNRLEGLHTLDSCEGILGAKPAHVYFNYGDWRRIGQLVFEQIGPALWGKFGNEAVVSLEVFNESEPMGKLSFDKEATDAVASLLDGLFYERP